MKKAGFNINEWRDNHYKQLIGEAKMSSFFKKAEKIKGEDKVKNMWLKIMDGPDASDWDQMYKGSDEAYYFPDVKNIEGWEEPYGGFLFKISDDAPHSMAGNYTFSTGWAGEEYYKDLNKALKRYVKSMKNLFK